MKECLPVYPELIIGHIPCVVKSAPFKGMPGDRPGTVSDDFLESPSYRPVQDAVNEAGSYALPPVLIPHSQLEDMQDRTWPDIQEIGTAVFHFPEDGHALLEKREECHYTWSNRFPVRGEITAQDEANDLAALFIESDETELLVRAKMKVFPCVWQKFDRFNPVTMGHRFVIEKDLGIQLRSRICSIGEERSVYRR